MCGAVYDPKGLRPIFPLNCAVLAQLRLLATKNLISYNESSTYSQLEDERDENSATDGDFRGWFTVPGGGRGRRGRRKEETDWIRRGRDVHAQTSSGNEGA